MDHAPITQRTHDPEPWRSVGDTARYYQVSEKTIRRWIAYGRLPAYKVGRQIRIRVEDAEQIARRIPSASIGGAA